MPGPEPCRRHSDEQHRSGSIASGKSAASWASRAIPRPRTTSTSGSTRCSTAARSRPGSSRARAASSHIHKGMGLVAEIFSQDVLANLPGRIAIGHVRYSTAGASNLQNAQPFIANTGRSQIAVAHNGNLTNALAIRAELEGHGSIFQGTMDSEVFVHLLARARGTLEERLGDMCSRVRGAWSAVFLIDDVLVAARDPHGFRPLSLGRLGPAWVVASETCAFDLIGAVYERDVEPGEIVIIRRGRLRSVQPLPRAPEKLCVFEHIYFARPDSLRVRLERVPDAQAARPRARARGAGRGRHGRAGARLGLGRGARLRRDERHPVRDRADPQPLRAPHLHRARAVDPHVRRAREAQPDPRARRGQAPGGGRGLDRARHHALEARHPVPRRRRARGAHPRVVAADHGPVLLRDRHADPRGADRREPQRRGDPPA